MEIEELVRAKLIELRKKHYPNLPDFTAKTKIHDANVRAVEMDGSTSLPRLKNLARWVRACGLSLSTFFAEIELREHGGKPPVEHPVVTAARALASRDPEAANALAVTLTRLSVPPSKKKQR